MRSFAERLITTVVGYSHQASELQEIKARLDDMQRQIDLSERQLHDLRDLNSHLENDLRETREKLEASRREASDYQSRLAETEQRFNVVRAEADAAKAELESLRNFLVARDEKVKELSDNLSKAKEELFLTESDRAHWQDKAGEFERQWKEALERISKLENEVKTAVDTRNSFAKERDSYRDAFEHIQSKLASVQAMFAPKPEPTPEPTPEPQPQSEVWPFPIAGRG